MSNLVAYHYFKDYWNNTIWKLTKSRTSDVRINGVTAVLNDIILEIEGQGLCNKNNSAYFLYLLSDLYKKVKPLKELCGSTFKLLVDTKLSDEYGGIVLQLCGSIKAEISSNDYFDKLVYWVGDELENIDKLTIESKSKIRFMTEQILAEFECAGFSLEDLSGFIDKIPGVLFDASNSVIVAPDEIDELNIVNYHSKEEYYSAIKEYCETRSIKKRLEILIDIYHKQRVDAYVIFRLSGIKGKIDYWIGGVNIYSPSVKRYISKEHSISKLEELTPGYDYLNAAIPVSYILPKTAINDAINKFEGIKDILALFYDKREPLFFHNNEYSIIIDGKLISDGYSTTGSDPRYSDLNNFHRYLDALDAELVQEELPLLNGRFNIITGDTKVKNRLLNASHWCCKANATTNKEDILLYSWLALEGLLKVGETCKHNLSMFANDTGKVLTIVQLVVSSILARRAFNNIWNIEYSNLCHLTNDMGNFNNLPEDVIQKASLNIGVGEKLRPHDFFANIHIVIDSLQDELLKDDLSYMIDFYSSDQYIKDYYQQVSNDILMIYRLRNMIVHNASIDRVRINHYYKIARDYSIAIVKYFITKAGKNPSMDIDEMLYSSVIEYKSFIKDFTKHVDSLKSKD